MEAGLILRIECVDILQCDFVFLMLDPNGDRPLDEDDVAPEQQSWFTALEDMDCANEYVEKKGNTTIEASWTLGGVDIEEDVQDMFGYLKQCGVSDVFGILAGDEGWYELWVLRQDKISRYDEWKGEWLEDMLFNEEIEPDFFVVLDRIRNQAV